VVEVIIPKGTSSVPGHPLVSHFCRALNRAPKKYDIQDVTPLTPPFSHIGRCQRGSYALRPCGGGFRLLVSWDSKAQEITITTKASRKALKRFLRRSFKTYLTKQ
jgi:hypothetical protein